MSKERAVELIHRSQVDEVIGDASEKIKKFLQELLDEMKNRNGIATSCSRTENGELLFTMTFRGHNVTAATMNSKPGNPLGMRIGMDIAIDGVPIDFVLASDFSGELRTYLAKRYSDASVLEEARKLSALAATL